MSDPQDWPFANTPFANTALGKRLEVNWYKPQDKWTTPSGELLTETQAIKLEVPMAVAKTMATVISVSAKEGGL